MRRDPIRPGDGALVTGAGRGLGAEIAKVLHARGLRVTVTDVDLASAEGLAAQLGDSADALALDVRDAEACREAARAVDGLRVWVNNAGVLFTDVAWMHSAQQRALMMDVNATGTMNGTLAALEVLRRTAGGGQVVNVVSLAGIVAAPGEAVYAASKHAALAFSLGTLLDLRRSGIEDIDVSCLCPDGIWTPMLFDKLDDPEAAASFSGARMLLPDEVAAKVGELLDDPRPVLTFPRSKGALLRVLDAFPSAAIRLIGPVQALNRSNQRRLKKRVERGAFPPR